MKNQLSDLHPSRVVARRVHDLEAELARARAYRRQHSKSPETLGRWGLEQPPVPEHEEGWFMTYLDMMTLLLVVMIVMLAFSGIPGNQKAVEAVIAAVTPEKSRSTSPKEAAGASSSAESANDTAPSPAHASPASSESVAASAPDPVTVITPGAEAHPPEAGTKQGTGLLPAGTGLLPGGHSMLAPDGATPVASAGAGSASGQLLPSLPETSAPLSSEASGIPEKTVPWLSGPRLSDMYPGFSANDLAASFVGPPKPGAADTEKENGSTPAPARGPSEGELLASQMALKDLGADVEVVVNEGSVSFRINSEILFDSSQADLSTSGLGVLRRIAAVLANSAHSVTVEGHTDSVPVRRNVRYPSNWELSSARAGSVVRYLQSNGVDRHRLKAVGYADTRSIADNNTPEGRARNRRVELVIEKPE